MARIKNAVLATLGIIYFFVAFLAFATVTLTVLTVVGVFRLLGACARWVARLGVSRSEVQQS